MEKRPEQKKPKLLTALAKAYSGSATQVALSAMSAWLIVTGLKGLAGLTVNELTALADLLGILIVIGIARWVNMKSDTK